ncbi:hypothetical protein EXIGLDRAFT_691607 [Exidia glandulosa HHB12029]|uniref:Uncharacterized protein n=1 Tax=Exidia glandulosa HHB12029 TaxID=1314781 RepID=A0A165Z0G2_EXIGL|nr:hypothetical protein EXIGLDRAFT_691607 [Exidia glandulosa HHB12029]
MLTALAGSLFWSRFDKGKLSLDPTQAGRAQHTGPRLVHTGDTDVLGRHSINLEPSPRNSRTRALCASNPTHLTLAVNEHGAVQVSSRTRVRRRKCNKEAWQGIGRVNGDRRYEVERKVQCMCSRGWWTPNERHIRGCRADVDIRVLRLRKTGERSVTSSDGREDAVEVVE